MGDCGTGGTIRFDGQWLWKSKLLLWQQPGCKLVSTISLTKPTAAITQADMASPIRDVAIYGLHVEKPDLSHLGRMVVLYVDNFTLLNFTIRKAHGALLLRGSNQEIAYGLVTDAAPGRGGGRVGIRHFGNFPKVPTSPGRPANVWVHDNDMESGDGTYQISLTNQGPGANVSADDYLFEDNVGNARDGPFILIGQSDRIGKPYAASITNAVFRRMNGTGVRTCLSMGNSDNPGGEISNILIEDVVFDCSTNETNNASAYVTADAISRVRHITLRRVSIMNSYSRALQISGPVEDVKFEDGVIGPPRVGGAAMVLLQGGLNTAIVNSKIATRGDGIVLGDRQKTTRQPIIKGNQINGVVNHRRGIFLKDTEGAQIKDNVIRPLNDAPRAIGIGSLPASPSTRGAVNSAISGNDLRGFRSLAPSLEDAR